MGNIADRCDFHIGNIINNRYYVEKHLGEGSFGKVFKVKDEQTKETYALKLLKLWEIPSEIRQQLSDRFDMEFETGKINSNYLVHSFSHGLVNGNPFIIMEFCPGGDLNQIMDNQKHNLKKIAREVLYGLRDLHRQGKVHRDLKPENVLIKQDGIAALTDFGISGDRNKRMTERNLWGKPTQIFGTYAYMPPEQVSRDKDATVLPTTDIFSFGVLMYQLITNELPFGQLNNERDLIIYLKNGREGKWNKSVLDNTPDGKLFMQVISGCLNPNFRLRLQTVDSVLSILPHDDYNIYQPAVNANPIQMKVIKGLQLHIMQGEEYGKVIKLNDLIQNRSKIITMGRRDIDTNNAIPIIEQHSSYISRKHCTLEFDDETNQWYIRDGQWDKTSRKGWKCSLNGTYVNSTEVSSSGMIIKPGDIISIGDVKLRVEGY